MEKKKENVAKPKGPRGETQRGLPSSRNENSPASMERVHGLVQMKKEDRKEKSRVDPFGLKSQS